MFKSKLETFQFCKAHNLLLCMCLSVSAVCICGVDAGCVNFFKRMGGSSLVFCYSVGLLVFYLVCPSVHVPHCCMGCDKKHVGFTCTEMC